MGVRLARKSRFPPSQSSQKPAKSPPFPKAKLVRRSHLHEREHRLHLPISIAIAVAITSCLSIGLYSFWTQNHQSFEYTSFRAETLKRYPYASRNLVLLADDRHFDPQTIQDILTILDNAYLYYLRITGNPPLPTQQNQVQGLLPIAVVRDTCGAGCGRLGSQGIEIQPQYLDELYLAYQQSGTLHHLIFYELGRNFWGETLQRKLDYHHHPKDGQDYRVVAEGFALFMQFQAMQAANVTPAPFRGLPFEQYRHEIRRYLEIYLANPKLTWENTLKIYAFPKIEDCEARQLCLSPGNLLAAFWLDLRDRYGDHFTQRFFWEVQRRPDTRTTQDAVDNFVLAASAGADRNLSTLFTQTWRWPLSPQARQELQRRYGDPVPE
ncbi:MAG: hypothetical protein EAZ61_04915 [Oscillatoriales cyanobacterium]|nr:MAG: hypothetical protein EAZ61_04915 [Oscillatoriales cyanobacterium]